MTDIARRVKGQALFYSPSLATSTRIFILAISPLLVLSSLSGCVWQSDEPETELAIRVYPGFHWNYGDLQVWHTGSGSVMGHDGKIQTAEFVVVQLPGWMRFGVWGDFWESAERHTNPDSAYQVKLAVTPDLQRLIAYKDACSLRLSDHAEGPWECSDSHIQMGWHPAGNPWMFGASEFIQFARNGNGTAPSSAPGEHLTTENWLMNKTNRGLKVEGNSIGTTAGSWFNYPNDFLLLFDRSNLTFASPDKPPSVINVTREDGTYHEFQLVDETNKNSSDVKTPSESKIPKRPKLPLHQRTDNLPFDLTGQYVSFSWSEAWTEIEKHEHYQDDLVLIRGGHSHSAELWTNLTMEPTTIQQWDNASFIVAGVGIEPHGYRIQRSEQLPVYRQTMLGELGILTEYSVDYFSIQSSSRNLAQVSIPSTRAALDEAANLTEWLTHDSVELYFVFTDVRNHEAFRLVYTFGGWGLLHSLDASTGGSLHLLAQTEIVNNYWADDGMIPFYSTSEWLE